MVKWLKDASLWDSRDVIYPVIGGSSSAHAYNLIDTDKFKLTFYETWSHNSSGMQPTGAYATTGWIPSVEGGGGLLGSIGVYAVTNSDGDYVDVGAANGNPKTHFQLYPRLYNTAYGSIHSQGTYRNDATGSTSVGWTFTTRSSASGSVNNYTQKNDNIQTREYYAYQNGLVTSEVYIGARNDEGSAVSRSNRRIAFVFFSSRGLTEAQGLALYTIVQKYQTLLGR